MMMSVFRQGRPAQQLDHQACVELAVDDEAMKMILHARTQAQTVLVGLEDGQAIIKPMETGDDRLSFESLYDTCISLREYRKMRELKVDSPADFPPSVYEAEILLTEFNLVPCVRVRFPAKGDLGAKETLKQLVNDEKFRAAMVTRFVLQILDSDDVVVATRGSLKVDEVAPPDLSWEFQDDV